MSSLWDLPAAELLARVASADPTPGGGSTAAISGALGAGLVVMALEISARHNSATDEVRALLPEAHARLDALKPHPDADVAAFDGYMAALGLPKTTPEEQAERKSAMQSAALSASRAPLAAARDLLAALQFAERAASTAHRNVVSDVGAGAHLLAGALHATLLNVDINLGGVPAGKRAELEAERRQLADEGSRVAGRVAELVGGRLT